MAAVRAEPGGCAAVWPAMMNKQTSSVSWLVVLRWSGWVGSNKVPKLLQGLLRKPGEQRGGAGPGVHHVKLEEEETTYLKV